jgi:hypothetical protein
LYAVHNGVHISESAHVRAPIRVSRRPNIVSPVAL